MEHCSSTGSGASRLISSQTEPQKRLPDSCVPIRVFSGSARSILDPYTHYLRQRTEQGYANGQQLYRAVRDQGYHGGYKTVVRWLQQLLPYEKNPTKPVSPLTNAQALPEESPCDHEW